MAETQKKKFFYGWVIVACLFLIAMLPMVFCSTFFSYYQMPICETFGCTYAEFSASNIASTVAGMLFSLTLAGKLGKGNTRLFMLIGGIVSAAALYAQSYITAIWQLYITFFIANFALSAITYVPINFLISQWFVDKKALVTSIIFTGSGVGGMLFSGVEANLIAQQGWRMGFRVTAIIILVTMVIVFLLVRKSPADMGLEPYRSAKTKEPAKNEPAAAAAPQWVGLSKTEALKTLPFWLYAISAVCCGIVAAGIMTQAPTYLTENSVNYAAAMAIFSGAGIFGKLVMGPIIDKVGIQKGTALTCGIGIIALICLSVVPQFGATAANASMVIFPFAIAITSLAPPLLPGMIFGYKDFGGIYGLGNTFFMAGCMIGPMLSSGIRTATGSYLVAWIAIMIVFALLAVTAILAVGTGKKLRAPAAD